MPLKGIRQAITDRDHALAGVRLGKSEIASIERSPDMQQTPFEVDIGPLKAKQLRDPHPCNPDQEDERAMWFLHMVQYNLEMLGLECYLGLNGMPVRKPNAGSRIVLQVTPLFCAATDATHRSAYVVQHRGGVAFGLLVEEYLQIWRANIA